MMVIGLSSGTATSPYQEVHYPTGWYFVVNEQGPPPRSEHVAGADSPVRAEVDSGGGLRTTHQLSGQSARRLALAICHLAGNDRRLIAIDVLQQPLPAGRQV